MLAKKNAQSLLFFMPLQLLLIGLGCRPVGSFSLLQSFGRTRVVATAAAAQQSSLFLLPGPLQQRWQQEMSLFKHCSKKNDNDDNDDDDEDDNDSGEAPSSINVLGTAMKCCCANVGGTGMGTGFYRNGFCSTGEQDLGRHTVCVQVTDEFLKFSSAVGNDLSTPFPQHMFPGLKGGDIWCLCAQRWAQAYQAGKAPKLFLQATHEKTLDYVPFEILHTFALDQEEADQRLDDLNEQREKLKKLL